MFASVRTLLVGGVVGKVTGVGRELVSASLFGTGAIAAAYRLSQAAFVIPLHGLVSESLSSGFTPTYARKHAENAMDTRALFAGMHAVVLIFSIVVGILVSTFAADWVRLLAPGFDAASVALTTNMVRVMVLAMPLFAFTSLCAAAELATGNAEMAAARATVTSIGLILGTVLGWWVHNPILIPAGYVLSYVWLAGWGLKLTTTSNLRIWPSLHDWREARGGMMRVWHAFRIVAWIPVIMQVHFVIERRVASVVDPNAVAALDYARFVSDTAVLLLAMPFGLAGLGAMARMNEDDFYVAAWRSLRMLLFIGLPLSAAIAMHSAWIVKVIFARGAFGAQSIATTAIILQGFGLGLWSQLIGYAGIKFLSSRGRTHVVAVIYIASMACNIVLNLTLPKYVGVAALGFSYAAGGWILGLAVMVSLKQMSALRADLFALAVGILGYVAVCLGMPKALGSLMAFPPVFFVGFWTLVCVIVPRYREVAVDLWRVLRPQRAPV